MQQNVGGSLENSSSALNTIYNNLMSGKIYAYWMDYVSYPCYSYVLTFDSVKKLFHWRHYGSSANKATKRELNWIIQVIFKMSPEEFANKYECVDRVTYNQI